MNEKEQLITKFYTAFQQLDYATMQSCYSPDIMFSDAVFGLLEDPEVGAMWEMLCKNAKDFNLSFSNIQLLDEEYCTCQWTAVYIFSKSGRRVTNRIKAHMRIQDGLITEHSDQFRFSDWAKQAFGVTGLLLGWTAFFQNKVRRQARMNLEKFMQAKTGAAQS